MAGAGISTCEWMKIDLNYSLLEMICLGNGLRFCNFTKLENFVTRYFEENSRLTRFSRFHQESFFVGNSILMKKGLLNDSPKLISYGVIELLAAGIPDFRSPSSGLYHNLEQYNLPHPTAIFEIDFFSENPEPFFVLAKQLLPEGFRPTPSHYFVRLLYEKGLLLRHYTQNIDTLERVAGIPGDKLVEAHGTFHTGKCLKCRKAYDLPWMKGNRLFIDLLSLIDKFNLFLFLFPIYS